MPVENAQLYLKPEQMGKIANALNNKMKGRQLACAFCQSVDFQVQPGLFVQAFSLSTNSIALSGKGLVCAVLTCKNCGYVYQFSLSELGLIDENGEWRP